MLKTLSGAHFTKLIYINETIISISQTFPAFLPQFVFSLCCVLCFALIFKLFFSYWRFGSCSYARSNALCFIRFFFSSFSRVCCTAQCKNLMRFKRSKNVDVSFEYCTMRKKVSFAEYSHFHAQNHHHHEFIILKYSFLTRIYFRNEYLFQSEFLLHEINVFAHFCFCKKTLDATEQKPKNAWKKCLCKLFIFCEHSSQEKNTQFRPNFIEKLCCKNTQNSTKTWQIFDRLTRKINQSHPKQMAMR